ncbi:hypothetical protein JCM10908_002143 [Rhodotorula pacifica]|uniref:uncharacterized protein n=1 Tax=Rhodotorula pacifica TaxID=1495444 RepID=UPI003177D614
MASTSDSQRSDSPRPAESAAPAAEVALRASINDLPTEVLTAIVDCVHKQDAALQKKLTYSSRSIPPLSLVNKRLRELALPFLIVTVKPRQLESAFFRYGEVPERLLAQITCLDLTTADEEATLLAAQSLPRFKNLAEVVISLEPSEILVPQSSPIRNDSPYKHEEEHPLAREAFAAFAPRITTVKMTRVCKIGRHSFSLRERQVLEAVAVPAKLRKLRFDQPYGPTFFDPTSTALQTLLADCQALEELVIREQEGAQSNITEPYRAAWLGRMQLQALETLELPGVDFAVFDLLQEWLPHLVNLTVRFPSLAHLGIDIDRTFCLPDLQRLALRGSVDVIKALRHLDLPRLISLELRVESPGHDKRANEELAAFDPVAAFRDVPLPRGIRFDLYTPFVTDLSDADWGAFRDSCAARDLDFTWWLVGVNAPFHEGLFEPLDVSTEEIVHERFVAIRSTAQWAIHRARWLVELQDTSGLQKLAEAFNPLAILKIEAQV